MKALQVLPVLLSLIYTTVSITKWPTHIICKNKKLEVNYRSCDPLQDVAFAIDSCTYTPGQIFTMQIGTVATHSINELYADISLILTSGSVPLFRNYTVCERNQPYYGFCGTRKGGYLYHTGPVHLITEKIPKGEFDVRAQFINEDHHTVICVDFYINKK